MASGIILMMVVTIPRPRERFGLRGVVAELGSSNEFVEPVWVKCWHYLFGDRPSRWKECRPATCYRRPVARWLDDGMGELGEVWPWLSEDELTKPLPVVVSCHPQIPQDLC